MISPLDDSGTRTLGRRRLTLNPQEKVKHRWSFSRNRNMLSREPNTHHSIARFFQKQGKNRIGCHECIVLRTELASANADCYPSGENQRTKASYQFLYYSEHIQLPQEVERAPSVAFFTHAYITHTCFLKKRLMVCYRHAFKLTVAPLLTLQIIIDQ